MNPTFEEIAGNKEEFLASFQEAHSVFSCIAYAMSMMITGKATIEAVADAFSHGFSDNWTRHWQQFEYDYAQSMVACVREGQRIIVLVQEQGLESELMVTCHLITTSLENMMAVEKLERKTEDLIRCEEEKGRTVVASLESTPVGFASEQFIESVSNRVAEKVVPQIEKTIDAKGNEIKTGVARAEAAASGRNPERVRTSADIVEFCQNVDKKVKTQDGVRKNENQAIEEAWKEVPGLPQNLSYDTKRRDYKLWQELKRRHHGKQPTVEEYDQARPRRGRPPKR